MEQEGVTFRTGVNVGVDVTAAELKSEFDAIVLAGGAGWPRDLPVPGRELKGIHFAMEYLTLSNRRCEGDQIPDDQFISAKGKRVVIIGGGDTGRRLSRHGAPSGRAVRSPVRAAAEAAGQARRR